MTDASIKAARRHYKLFAIQQFAIMTKSPELAKAAGIAIEVDSASMP